MSCVSFDAVPRKVLSVVVPTASDTNAGTNNELALLVNAPLLKTKLAQSSSELKLISDQVAKAPAGLTVGHPLASVELVPDATGVAIAGPPLAIGSQQMVGVWAASPSIWNTDLSTICANVGCGLIPSKKTTSASAPIAVRILLESKHRNTAKNLVPIWSFSLFVCTRILK